MKLLLFPIPIHILFLMFNEKYAILNEYFILNNNNYYMKYKNQISIYV